MAMNAQVEIVIGEVLRSSKFKVQGSRFKVSSIGGYHYH
jgi:hypothetical protein